MPVALLDTNILFASASARDDYHERAQEIVRGIDGGIHTTQASGRHSVELLIRERSLWIVDGQM